MATRKTSAAAKTRTAAPKAPAKAARKAAAKAEPPAKRAPLAALGHPSASETASAAPHKPVKQRARLVRDGFTMPEDDFALIAALKGRALSARRAAKKSELLRAGLHTLMALDAQALVAALERLQPLKVGRPKKGY